MGVALRNGSGNDDAGVAIKTIQEEHHALAIQSNAPFGWFETAPREMNENRTSAAANGRATIPVGFNHNVIEVVITPQGFMRRGRGQRDRPIIAGRCDIVTPAETGCDGS